jgi:hypothetical protein
MTKIDQNHDDNGTDVSKPAAKQPQSIVEFFRQSPLMGLDIDLERDRDPGREIDFGFDDQDEG